MTGNAPSDNISARITRIYIETNTSSKTGNPYNRLVTEWNLPNGSQYLCKLFINDEQKALIESSVPMKSDY